MKKMNKISIPMLLSYAYVSLCCFLLILPFLITFYRSLLSPTGAFTMENYWKIAGIFWPKVNLSAYLAAITVVLDLILALPAAFALTRYEFPGKRFLTLLMTAVWYVPGISYALAIILALYFFFKPLLNIGAFIATFTCGFFPIMLMSCIVAFRNLDLTYEEAAMCLGAGKLKTFFYIVLPLIGPGISSGVLLTFILAFNEFITSFLLMAPTGIETAPVKVFDDISHAGMHGFIAAEAALLQIISLAACFIYLKIIGTRYLRGTVLF